MENLLLESAVRSILIALFTGAALYILRVKAPRARHIVWSSVVMMMLVLPIWTTWGPRAALRVLDPAPRPAVSTAAISSDVRASDEQAPVSAVRHTKWTWQNSLGAIYLFGVLILLARLAVGTARAQRLMRRAESRDGRLTSSACTAPITIGLLKPAVILPARWSNWTQAQLDAVLTHEGEHARRRDPLFQWLALLNRAIFWFHPLAWWLERRLSALAEEACDAEVLARGQDPVQYSEYLLELAHAVRQTGARVSLVGMAMPGTSLPSRIQRILDAAPRQRISGLRSASMATACVMISAVFTASALDSRPQIQKTIQASVRASSTQIPAEARKAIDLAPKHQQITASKALVAQAQTRRSKSEPAGTGSISGTVEDPGGARVPNCVITARNQADASVVTAVSDPAGSYRLMLPAGEYTLDFASPGFAHFTVHAQIDENMPARIDALLELGKVDEHVTVTRPKPAVQAPATSQPARPARIRVGGWVQPLRLISKTNPVYPTELEQQGVEGTVLIRAVISKDGQPLSPHVLNNNVDQRFVQAALDSVGQWRYQPAMLNGEPVETVTTITVDFRLAQ